MIEFVKEENLYQNFEAAKTYMSPLFQPFAEFERIARNRPHPSIPKEMPRVTDGTLAGLIQETPKRIIQQIPTGKVKANDEWLSILATYILEKEILANSDYVVDLIQKCWAMTSKALTYGSQPVFVQFLQRGDNFVTDFSLPYIKHVLLEPGKLSDKDSNVIWVRTFWQRNQIEQIIEKEQNLSAKAKKRGEAYDGSWDIKALKEVLDKADSKDYDAQTPNEHDKGIDTRAIELDHCFQRGVGAKFYTISPITKKVVRRKKNKDPRGAIPIHYMYANVDLSNPLGRGSVEMSGGMQNLLDSEVQTYQYMRAMMMNPTIVATGKVSASMIKFKPKHVIKISDPNATIKPLDLSTSSLERFPENYGLIKSQILNLNNSLDTSISSESGNPGFSKTPAGINANEVKLGVADNYIRKQFEANWQDVMETEVNLYFAEREGVSELEVDKATAAKLRKVEPDSVNEKNMVRIDYSGETEKLRFRVDPSTSSLKDNQQQVDVIGGLIDKIEATPILQKLVPEDKIIGAWNAIVASSGIEDPEKLQIDDPEVDPETGQPKQAGAAQPALGPEQVQQMIQEALAQQQPQEDPRMTLIKALGMKFNELPEDAQKFVLSQLEMPSDGPTGSTIDRNIKKLDVATKSAQAAHTVESSQVNDPTQDDPEEDLTNETLMLQTELKQRGYSDDQVAEAEAMLKDPNNTLEDVLASLHPAAEPAGVA